MAAPFGWMAISKLENQFVYITTIQNLIYWKFILKPILSCFVGPFAAPFYIIGFFLRRAGQKREGSGN